MDYKLINGREVAREINDHNAAEARTLAAYGWAPRLVSITIGNLHPISVYVRNQKRVAAKVGIEFDERDYPAEITEGEMLSGISAMNADPRVTGIIIQRPVPDHLNIRALQRAVHPLKDVEGMHPASIGNILYQELELGPCTAMASIELLKHTELALEGLEVVVIGHSEIVGKPIAFLLLAEGATVTVCHHMTRNLAVHSRSADAIFVAVGEPELIDKDMIKPGAAVIDIGINRLQDEEGNWKTVGDCQFDSCKEIAGWITPVPGGVGPVTVAILMRNTLVAARRQRAHYDHEFSRTDMTVD